MQVFFGIELISIFPTKCFLKILAYFSYKKKSSFRPITFTAKALIYELKRFPDRELNPGIVGESHKS